MQFLFPEEFSASLFKVGRLTLKSINPEVQVGYYTSDCIMLANIPLVKQVSWSSPRSMWDYVDTPRQGSWTAANMDPVTQAKLLLNGEDKYKFTYNYIILH